MGRILSQDRQCQQTHGPCLVLFGLHRADQKVFWEHWYWQQQLQEDGDEFLKDKVCANHTKTIAVKNDKVVDYPIWPVRFDTTMMKMYPAIDLKCIVIAPFGISMQPIAFPTDDSRTEFRVDYAEIFGKKMYFIFALDPHISEEDKAKCFQELEKQNGILREWFHEIQWEKDYVLGSTGEPDINPK